MVVRLSDWLRLKTSSGPEHVQQDLAIRSPHQQASSDDGTSSPTPLAVLIRPVAADRRRRVGRHSPGRAAARSRLEGTAGELQGHHLLLALVTCASMMPVEKLPLASW